MNQTQVDSLMESESFRHGMIASIAQDVFGGKHQTIPVYTDNEIERGGFHKIHAPTFTVEQKSFCCVTRKVVPWTKTKDCDVTQDTTKSQIVDAIRKIGFTHLFEVMANYADFSFDLKSLEPAFCVMVKGATVKS